MLAFASLFNCAWWRWPSPTLPIKSHNQLVDYSAPFSGAPASTPSSPPPLFFFGGGGYLSFLRGTLDTKVSGVLAVTVPSGGSFQSLMVAGKKDACLHAVRLRICVSSLEWTLHCLGGAGINLELSTTTLPLMISACGVGERATHICRSVSSLYRCCGTGWWQIEPLVSGSPLSCWYSAWYKYPTLYRRIQSD